MGDLGRDPEEGMLGMALGGFEAVGTGCAVAPGVATPGESSPAIAEVD